MYQKFLILLLCCEGIACLTSLLYWKLIKQSIWKYFSIYLTFIFLAEIFGYYCRYKNWISTNIILMDYVVLPIEFLFFFWLFYKQHQTLLAKKMTLLFSIIYLASLCIEPIFKNQIHFFSLSYLIGNLLLLIIVIKSFLEFMKEKNILEFSANPYFYINVGLLLFFLGTFPYYGFLNLWYQFPKIGNQYFYIATILNCIMYCMFTISFLCNNKQKSI